jgi:hypothetical protein
MSADQPGPGNSGHLKGMASAVYLYESERGNVYPRLDLSIDYRDPKHVRIRAYDEDHKVVDTLGANDVAEACLLAGMTIRYGETMYARKLRASATPPRAQRRRPPVALRFLDALTLQLRRQKAAGAAEAVHRAASLQFHPQNWRAEQEPPQVLAVAEFALRHWAIEGLRQLRGEREHDAALQLEGYLAPRPPFSAAAAADSAALLKPLAAWLKQPDEVPGPNPVTKNGVARVLAETAVALEHAGRTQGTDPSETASLPGDPLARSVEHSAQALAAAFRAGVVTQLPPASGAVFALLDRIGH